MLGVSAQLLADPKQGPVSPECARQMVEGTRKLSKANIAVSITGIAGPSGAEEGKPVGTAYLGFASDFRETQVVRINITSNSRDAARRRFCTAMMILALEYAKGGSIIDMVNSWVYI
jgi:nicotinamide-nucleotide amidase